MNAIDIDKELGAGVVSLESYQQLLDAEIYGTATPMQWLVARLKIIQNLVKSGGAVRFDSAYESGVLLNEEMFVEWCKKNFPNALSCINKI